MSTSSSEAKIHQTIFTDSQMQWICTQFALGDLQQFTLLKGGLANTNIRLDTSSGTYMLKQVNEKTQEQMTTWLAVLDKLKDAGFTTCYAHPTASGDSLLTATLDDALDVRAILFDFITGTSPSTATCDLAADLGSALADLHAIDPTDLNLPPFAMGLAEINPFLDWAQDHTDWRSHDFVTMLRKDAAAIADASLEDSPDLPRGIVHGDIFLDNILCDKDARLLAIVDFEEVCDAPLLLDVAMTLIGCCYPSQDALDLDSDLVLALLNAYVAKRPLVDAETPTCLGLMVQYALLSITFWRFRQFEVRHPGGSLAGHYKAPLARLERVKTLGSDFWADIVAKISS